VEDKISKLINEYKLYYCVECGKCVAGCPMNEIYDDFSYSFCSRGIIRKAMLEQDVVDSGDIWRCLRCDLCANVCPAGVSYAQFIADARNMAMAEGHTENAAYCECCGEYYLPLPTVDAYHHILDKNERPNGYTKLCPKCKTATYAGNMKLDAFRLGK
jgi:heterodisulfide reductase subunit C